MSHVKNNQKMPYKLALKAIVEVQDHFVCANAVRLVTPLFDLNNVFIDSYK